MLGSSLLLAKSTTTGFVLHHRQAFGRLAIRSADPSAVVTRQLQQFRHFSFLSDLFSGPTLASQSEVQAALKDPSCALVDIRSEDEIKSSGKVKVGKLKWVHAPGSPFDCPTLSSDAEKLLPHKEDPVVLYCASGKRAGKAKEILESKGYQNVLNAGGASDLMSYL